MFTNTKIRTLLSWGFGFIILLIAIMSAITFQRSNSVVDHVVEVTGSDYQMVTAASELRLNVFRNWSNTLLLLIVVDANESRRITDEMAANSKLITEKFEYLNKTIVTDAGKQHLAAMLTARKDYTENRKQYLELIKSANKVAADQFLTSTLHAKLEAYVQAINGLITYQSEQMESSSAETVSLASGLKKFNIGLSLLVALVACVTAVIVVRVIVHALGGEVFYAKDIARQIAAGNLGIEVHTAPGDETSLLASMKTMREQLRNMVFSIEKGSEQVGQAARELVFASQSVADSSDKQRAASAAVAAAVEEMTASIGQIADNTSNAYAISMNSEETSRKGGAIILNAASEMGKIAESVESSSAIIGTLELRSNEISAVANIIKEIAEQTNLLALNAAIEAARAGEQGRGFAVVADEVRKLAERTAQSTHEISSTIQKIHEDTQSAVQSMVVSVEQVRLGTTLTQQAGASIVEIESEAKNVTGVVSGITSSLKEQTDASNEIARNIEHIASMIEENNVASAKAAGAAKQLEQLADGLLHSICTFRL